MKSSTVLYKAAFLFRTKYPTISSNASAGLSFQEIAQFFYKTVRWNFLISFWKCSVFDEEEFFKFVLITIICNIFLSVKQPQKYTSPVNQASGKGNRFLKQKRHFQISQTSYNLRSPQCQTEAELLSPFRPPSFFVTIDNLTKFIWVKNYTKTYKNKKY